MFILNLITGVEAMAPNVRVRFIFIIFCFQSLGNLLTGLLAYYVRDWATLQLYLFVPMVVTISYFL
jgi:OCT family organic cation transporter-like MFS transporter 4/5